VELRCGDAAAQSISGGLLVAAALVALLVVTDVVAVGEKSGPCSRTASPPHVAKLIRQLRPGQTGCLRGGVYRGKVAIHKNGITLRSAPSQHATIVGIVEITGDHVIRRARSSSTTSSRATGWA
jgi:hypothetical protein